MATAIPKQWGNLEGASMAVLVVSGLLVVAGWNYLLFHSLSELFSIFVAFAMFAVAWNARGFAASEYLLYVGLGYQAVGALDLLHTLAYKGMGVFPLADSNLPTQLWMAARLMEAGTLLGACLLMRRTVPLRWLNSGILGMTMLLGAAVFDGRWFPDCYIEGQGLTLFKTAMEYALTGAFLLAALLLWRRRALLDSDMLAFLLPALLMKAAGEISFTFYVDVYDLPNMIGHLLKVSSNLLIYRAIVLSCFRHPYELLFLRLSRARDQLEATVLERTRELSQANAILQDEIVQRRAADEKLRATVAELERSNNELEQFAYVASHDLQEPLRMVTSYTQLLHRRYVGRLDQDADDFIHFAVDGARRMERMIHDLLDYSRVHSRGQPLEPVESRQAIAGAVNNLRSAIEEVQATLNIPADPPLVMADAGQLERLFQNLIGNAIKYRRPGMPPRVTVSAKREGGFWRFEIADNGIGIDPQYYERIFMVFQRLHTREQYPGTGIGLAICKKIVDRHGGHIGVRSTPGEGSTFWFTLPAAPGLEGL